MKAEFEYNCKATMIGSLPSADAESACRQVIKYLPGLPAWPQLPARSSLENMYVQYSEGFPGAVIADGKVTVKPGPEFDDELALLYLAHADNNVDRYAVSPDYAAGLYALAGSGQVKHGAVKGQVTGPVSWGLCVTDASGRGILYDDLLADAAAKFLRLKAAWQEKFLRKLAPQTVIFIDEPYLASLGSAFISISSEQVSLLLEEVLSGLSGIKGIHCCGGTDWTLLLKSSIDVLNFDAYNYFESLACYPDEVHAFIKRGGAIAWGIVPNDEEVLQKESLPSLSDRLEAAIAFFSSDGISFKELVSRSLVTPSCGLDSLSPDAAEEVFRLLAGLSEKFRAKYT